ncbi:hypothetical protein D3C71_1880520 [compost metagenome]
MKHDGNVLARLDDLVEVADPALAHGARQGTVDPDRIAPLQQVAPRQVRRGQIVMAGDGGKRQAELCRHMADKTGLAATGRPLEQERQLPNPGILEQRALVARGAIGGNVDRYRNQAWLNNAHGMSP